jgi:hypothetical protein
VRQLVIRLAIVLIVAATTAVTTFVATWFYYQRTMQHPGESGPGGIRVYLFPLGWVVVTVLALAWLGVVYWIVSPVIRSR